jgi:proteasome lid subunit RPN8/RPN11
MQSSIKLISKVEKEITIHGEEAFPNECCGFLFGNETNDRVINLSTRVENNKEGDQRRRFEISPFDYMKAEQFAIENNTQLLGIYHSHPNHPAIASVHDLEKAMPYFSYIIVSIMDGKYADIKSWKLFDEKREFHEELVLVAKTLKN